MPRPVLRAAWLLLGSVAACVGLGWALWAFHDGAEAVVGVPALLRYAGVVVVLGGFGYVVERRLLREDGPFVARRQAAVDAVVVGFLGGPVLFAVVEFVALLGDCADGAGC